MSYLHLLLTRFNLNFSSYFETDKIGKKVRTAEWLQHRFDLFEKYCFPSVKAQTNQNFKWFVLFDACTPDTYKKKIDQYKVYDNFIPFFIRPDEYWLNTINKEINSRNPSAQYIMTTRLDNDDAIHFRFMEEMKSYFSETDDYFIRFLNGYQWNVNLNILTEFFEEWGNHFSSRIEKVRSDKIQKVLGIDNTKITKLNVPIIDIKEKRKRLWLEIIHDKNLCNHYRILKPVFTSSILHFFSINEKIDCKQSVKMLLLYIKKNLKILINNKSK